MVTRGKKIQTIRVLRSLSQEGLAEMANLSPRSISLAENDHSVGRRVISGIEHALDIRLDSPELDAIFERLLGQPAQPDHDNNTDGANIEDRENRFEREQFEQMKK